MSIGTGLKRGRLPLKARLFEIELHAEELEKFHEALKIVPTGYLGYSNKYPLEDVEPKMLKVRKVKTNLIERKFFLQCEEHGPFHKLLIKRGDIEPKAVDFIKELGRFGNVTVRRTR